MFSNVRDISCAHTHTPQVQLYDPQEAILDSAYSNFGFIFLWSHQLIAFFILLNALLAIIVESYERTKTAAAVDRSLTADQIWIQRLCGHHKVGVPEECYISEPELLLLFRLECTHAHKYRCHSYLIHIYSNQ